MSETRAGAAPPSAGVRRIAIAGNPNAGKTTVFNKLTGLRHKVGNYAGVTVEKREGKLEGTDIVLLDLPGTYSLSARSPDQEIARDVLFGRMAGTARPDAVLVVIDANNLERNLYLASQVLELGLPALVACNMVDVAQARGVSIDPDALSDELGVPVISIVASKGKGIDDLRSALKNLPTVPAKRTQRSWELPETYEQTLATVATVLSKHSSLIEPHAVRGAALLWMMDHLSADPLCRESAKRLLADLPPGDAEQLRAAGQSLTEQVADPVEAAIEARYAWISTVAGRVAIEREDIDRRKLSTTDRIDLVLTHRVFGMAIFALVMFLVFLSIFSWAEPLMNVIETGQGALAKWVGTVTNEGPMQSFLTDGMIAGVGAVLIFLPQICILFLVLSILENSGYMARAAFLMDRLMNRVGLHGKSFIPLMSCYACAIPGIMATRMIENRRDRLTTIMVAPFMSCSARLPVYIIVIGAVFGDRLWLKAGVMFAMYALGTVTALLMALLFKRTLFKGPRLTFIMELPPYHMPQPRVVVREMWVRSQKFLTGAGTSIFAVCVLIWAMSYFPRIDRTQLPADVESQIAQLSADDQASRENIIAGAQLRQSALGRLGHFIEPVIAPLGYDWRLGIGVLSSFLAREVFVSTMGITYSVGEADETSVALRDKLANAKWPDGRTVLTPAVGLGLMVFYVLACQCISTLAVVRKETGSWRWPALMFVYMTTLAYVSSLAVYQIGSRLG